MIRNEKGFTLIELMVVVLIIGILVAVAIPVFGSAAENARDKACDANMRTLDGASAQYQAEFNEYPDDVAILVTQQFLKTAPTDPHANFPGGYGFDATGTATSASDHNLGY